MVLKYRLKDILFVALQLLLFFAYCFRIKALDFPIDEDIRFLGLNLAIFSVFLLLPAFIQLKENLSPFPSPKEKSSLVTTGIYKYLRHPVYTGIVCIAAGYGLYSENSLRLLVSEVLVMLLFLKARYEESLLAEKFPEYEGYKTKTASFLPGIY